MVKIDWSVDQFCLACKKQIKPRSQAAPGYLVHTSRGLCGSCRTEVQRREAGAKKRLKLEVDSDGRVCSKCLEYRQWQHFSRSKAQKSGYCTSCRDCDYARKYNLSLQEYKDMLVAQNNMCSICKRPPTAYNRLVVDHDHKCCPPGISCGQCIRGIICFSCNITLGHASDNPAILIAMAKYIQNYEKR